MKFTGIKRKLIITLIILFSLICLTALIVIAVYSGKDKSDISNQEAEEPGFNVLYMINNGQISGEAHQYVKSGEDTTVITVFPNIGYRFVKWEDTGSTNPTRQDFNVQQDIIAMAIIEGPLTCHVIFQAGEGGTVEGVREQNVTYGGKGETVVAVPDEGFKFVKWSDGETKAVRENTSVTWYGGQPYITAEFIRYSRKFEYVYNDGISKSGEKEIEINLDNIDEVTLPIPEREDCQFEGWYSDWHYEIQVADKNGKMQVGIEWLNKDELYDYTSNPEGYLYAKWTTSKKLPNYKILMIYITEVHGDFTYWSTQQENENVRVDYVMTDIQEKMCSHITEYMYKYLNALFNETVRFEVDEYFTTESVNEKLFTTGDGKYFEPIVNATNGIKEVHDLIPNYDSVITTFSLSGYENNFKLTGGIGGTGMAKYANVVFDTFLYGFDHVGSGYYGDEIVNIFDNNYQNSFQLWESYMNSYIHEFIHTVEMQAGIMDNMGLHASYHHYANTNGSLNPIPYNVDIPYLLGKYEVDEEVWGIPYEFWVNNDKKETTRMC